MKHFTYEEMELMSIYDPGTREGLIANLEEMRGFLEPETHQLLQNQHCGETFTPCLLHC